MHPQVSVILPYFNAELTLQRAIDSILKQTFTNFELLLINNNSTDKSNEIARHATQNDPRIVLLDETLPGVANAMNCGLKNACGQFVARMDADDVAHPERLEKQYTSLKDNPSIDFVGSEVEYVPHIAENKGFRRFVNWTNSFHSPEEIVLKQFIEIPVVNPTIFFRRKWYENFGGCLDGNFPEDYEMQLRYLSNGAKMAKLPEKLLEWHDYSTRLTRTDDRYSTEAFFQTKAIYFRKWSEQHNPFHPNIWIWGAGRKTRQRSTFLQEQGLIIEGYIDIKKSKPDALFYEDLPQPGQLFIVSMVTNTGAGEKIHDFLKLRNYNEGKDFILMG
ncbi:glycosyltransferase family 2 protein [Draconibacterium sp. IB214405]|uniref:glycosyltransferase family 2 protein n=1 Tax=Draconibacterium sp. IB214405 TaxID=3097352 RepID=UPI002A0DC3C8|nr:glycosyltransferase family 2 protein [Draconibacterium sp. IB214405]MDX8337694.1 glycosyltransferase family 2 protein [Draconibacterium sp. IB214405]